MHGEKRKRNQKYLEAKTKRKTICNRPHRITTVSSKVIQSESNSLALPAERFRDFATDPHITWLTRDPTMLRRVRQIGRSPNRRGCARFRTAFAKDGPVVITYAHELENSVQTRPRPKALHFRPLFFRQVRTADFLDLFLHVADKSLIATKTIRPFALQNRPSIASVANCFTHLEILTQRFSIKRIEF